MVYQGIVFYTLWATGAFATLIALPGCIKPWKHLSTFLPNSLPEDEKSIKQLSLLWFMIQSTNVQIGLFLILSAYACPCLPIVGFAAFVFMARAGMGSWFIFGPPSEFLGPDTKAVAPLFAMTGVFVIACVTAIVLGSQDEEYMAASAEMEAAAPAKFEEYPALVFTLAGVAGFFVLANAPAMFAPSMALESYFVPGAVSADKYTAVKFKELMRIAALGWTLLSLGQLAGFLMAPDYAIYGPMAAAYNLFFVGLFVNNIANAADYGFTVPPALFFLFLVSASFGAVALGLALI